MTIAIVAATELELTEMRKFQSSKHTLQFFVHGAGMLAATFHLQIIASKKPDLIIQCGIAGSYDDSIAVGQTVIVSREMTDTGAEELDSYLTLNDLSLADPDEFPYEDGMLPCPFLHVINPGLRQVKGLTVNCVSGTELTISKRKLKYGASIETMEGAALHFVGLMTGIPFLQVKTISNKVEIRNRSNWDIPLALAHNALAVKEILEKLK